MAFCTNCGNQLNESADFCANCGARTGEGDGSSAPVAGGWAEPAVVEPIEYKIEGDNLQIVRIRLKPGQEIYAEAGKMVYKTPSVEWQTQMTGEGLGQKLFGALKRKLAGESLFMTHFRATGGEGEIGLAGETLQVDTGCIVAFDETVAYEVQLAGGIKTGLFGGEGLFLAILRGPGKAIIQTMTLAKLRRELGGGLGARSGGGESRGLGSLTNIFRSND